MFFFVHGIQIIVFFCIPHQPILIFESLFFLPVSKWFVVFVVLCLWLSVWPHPSAFPRWPHENPWWCSPGHECKHDVKPGIPTAELLDLMENCPRTWSIYPIYPMIRHLHEANIWNYMYILEANIGSPVEKMQEEGMRKVFVQPPFFSGLVFVGQEFLRELLMERAPILPYLTVVADKTFIYITSHHQNLLIQLNHLNLRPCVKPLKSVENEGVVKWCLSTSVQPKRQHQVRCKWVL